MKDKCSEAKKYKRGCKNCGGGRGEQKTAIPRLKSGHNDSAACRLADDDVADEQEQQSHTAHSAQGVDKGGVAIKIEYFINFNLFSANISTYLSV